MGHVTEVNPDTSRASIQADVDFLADETNDKPITEDKPKGEEPPKDRKSFDDLVEKEITDKKEAKETEDKSKLEDLEDKTDENLEKTEKVDEEVSLSHNFDKFKAENPEIAKKNPWIRRAVYLEHEFTKLFPSVDDAKQAVAALGVMNQFEQSILGGKSDVLLGSLEKQDKVAFKKFAKGFVETLAKVDRSVAVEQVITPIINTMLKTALGVGEQSGNKNLALAARHIANWLHGSPDIPDIPADKVDPEEMVSKRENEIYAQQGTSWRDGLIDRTNQRVIDIISDSLKSLDIPQLTKKAAIGEIFDLVMEELANDLAHSNAMRQYFGRALSEVKTGNHVQYESRIQSAFLERAKQAIPRLRTKVLEGILPKATAQKSESRRVPANGTVPTNTKKITRDAIRKMSDMDILKIGAED